MGLAEIPDRLLGKCLQMLAKYFVGPGLLVDFFPIFGCWSVYYC